MFGVDVGLRVESGVWDVGLIGFDVELTVLKKTPGAISKHRSEKLEIVIKPLGPELSRRKSRSSVDLMSIANQDSDGFQAGESLYYRPLFKKRPLNAQHVQRACQAIRRFAIKSKFEILNLRIFSGPGN